MLILQIVKTADNKEAYDIPLVKGSVIVADRFYNDFSLLNIWDNNEVYIAVRHKKTLNLRRQKKINYLKTDIYIYQKMRLLN